MAELWDSQKRRWIDKFEVSEVLWIKTKESTKQTIIHLLDSADILMKHLKNSNNRGDYTSKVCAGLYTFALEEYGKLVYLKQLVPSNGQVKIEYRDKFRYHPFKFAEIEKVLPGDCLKIHHGDFMSGDGGFMGGDGNFDVSINADFQARLGVFYTDFRRDGLNVEMVPPVDVPLLEAALDRFRQIVQSTTI